MIQKSHLQFHSSLLVAIYYHGAIVSISEFLLKTSKTRGFLLFMEPVKSVLEFKLPLEWFPFPDPPSKSRVDFTIFIARMVPSCWSVHSLIVPMHEPYNFTHP